MRLSRAPGKTLEHAVNGGKGTVHQWCTSFGGDDARQPLFHFSGQLGEWLDCYALAALVDKHVVASCWAEPGQLECAHLLAIDELEPGAELDMSQLFSQRQRASRVLIRVVPEWPARRLHRAWRRVGSRAGWV